MKNILYLSHLLPYPPYGGDRMRANGIIELLKAFGSVHVVTPPSNEFFQQEHVFHYPFDFESKMKPVLRYFWNHPALIQHLKKILKSTSIDWVWIDYQFYGTYIPFF